MLNVEIKAICCSRDKVRKILVSLGADFKGTDRQIDTYFKTNKGRLKLREGNIENNLIYYERENTNQPKESNFSLYRSPNPGLLKEILTNAFGILAVVDKKREIYYIDNVKFHLDEVKNLGSFAEIEATDISGTIGKDKLYEQCKYYLKLFGIKESDLLSVSYSDMILNSEKTV